MVASIPNGICASSSTGPVRKSQRARKRRLRRKISRSSGQARRGKRRLVSSLRWPWSRLDPVGRATKARDVSARALKV